MPCIWEPMTLYPNLSPSMSLWLVSGRCCTDMMPEANRWPMPNFGRLRRDYLLSCNSVNFRYLFRGSRFGSAFHAGTNALTQHGNLVKDLPRGVDIGAAEVTEGGGGLEDGATQIQGLDDGSRAQVKVFVDQAYDFLV